MNSIKLYIACSLDGYIAGPQGEMDFLDLVQQPGEDYGYAEFMKSIDVVVMGRATFDWVWNQLHASPHPDKPTYVITHNASEAIGTTQFWTSGIEKLVEHLDAQAGINILCDGGAQVIAQLLALRRIDECTISFIPTILGGGTALFSKGTQALELKTLDFKHYASGLVQVKYKVVYPTA